MTASPATTVLAHVDLDVQLDVPELYYHRSRSDSLGSASEVAGAALTISARESVSFDAYFNTFFERCWLEHTSLAALTLQLHVSGAGTVTVVRARTGGDREVLHTLGTFLERSRPPLRSYCGVCFVVSRRFMESGSARQRSATNLRRTN